MDMGESVDRRDYLKQLEGHQRPVRMPLSCCFSSLCDPRTAHIHAPEKVVVSAGHRPIADRLQVLQVGLHHGGTVFECLHQPVFALNERSTT